MALPEGQSRRRNAVDAIKANFSNLLCVIVTGTVPDAAKSWAQLKRAGDVSLARTRQCPEPRAPMNSEK